MSPKSEYFSSLDLCRGLAAITVLIYHVDFLFFGTQTLVKRGYLCVDFFFLLSGFVIANSYERKLSRGMGFREFVVVRIARLWPLVALTTLIGLIVQLPRWKRDFAELDAGSIVLTALFAAAGLPTPTPLGTFFFPINGAAWSIFFEFAVNIAYALLLPLLNRRTLISLVVVSALLLLVAAIRFNSIDVGWSTSNILFGVPRALLSFCLGVLIWRLDLPRLIAHPFRPVVLFAGLAFACLVMNVPREWLGALSGLYDVAVVSLLFPALMLVAVRTELASTSRSIASFLGGISYSVYLLQTPLLIGFSGLPQILLGRKVHEFTPVAGFIFIPACIALAWLTWVYFELPAQKWVKSTLLGRKSPTIDSPAQRS